MIRITARLADGVVVIRGHAGFADKGRDIVCAGVSMAADILQVAAQRTQPHEVTDTGDALLVQGTGDEWTHVMIAVVASMSRLAKAYPDNVEVVLGG